MFSVDTDIDQEEVEQLVQSGVRAIIRSIEIMATELRTDHIPDEAPRGPTGNLKRDWRQRQLGPIEWVVFPGSDAWYAHIVAGGRRAFGPDRADALSVEGEYVARVSGIPANPFHLRALDRATARADEILADALAAEGID